jgi:hypothetical protein
MMEKKAWADLLAAPRDFVHGLLGGLLGPLLALAGAVGLIYVLTGQLPALKEVIKKDGTQHKAITLTSPLEARATWARYGGELRGAILELRARAQSRTEA